MLKILGYDGTTVTELSCDTIGDWLQQAGARVWLRGVAPTAEEIEWLKTAFSLNGLGIEGWPTAAAYLHPTPRFITGHLPLFPHNSLGFYLGHQFIITQETEQLRPLDLLWQTYQNDLSRWPYGLDYLLYQILHNLLPLSIIELNRLRSIGESPSPPPHNTALYQNIHSMYLLQHNLSQWQVLSHSLAQLEHPLVDANIGHQFVRLHRQTTAHQAESGLVLNWLHQPLDQQTQQQTHTYLRRLFWLTVMILFILSLLLLTTWLTL